MNNYMENRETPEGLSANEQAIMEKEISGRSLLEQRPELAMSDREKQSDPDGRLTRETIVGEDGQPAYEKRIGYVRDKDDEGNWQNTDEVKAINERVFSYNADGQKTSEVGTNLDREHSWQTTFEYDTDGNPTTEHGTITEGDRMGETWVTQHSTEQVGEYTKKTEAMTITKITDGEEREVTVTKVNYLDADGTTVYGRQEALDGGKSFTMSWGEKPEVLATET